MHSAASPAEFFAQPEFAGFVVLPGENVMDTFNRLDGHEGWTKGERKRALVLFNLSIGAVLEAMDFSKLEALQQLIEEYGLEPKAGMPQSVGGCRAVLSRLHVNIYDYVSGNRTRRFPSAHKLAEYSRKNKKIFPKARAKENHATKILLRSIFFGRL
jgi:hypothetical protein